MIGVLHCMVLTSGRVHVTGYETEAGGTIARFDCVCRNWDAVVALIAITAPVRTLVSDAVLLDAHAEPSATRTRAGEWAARRQAWEARRVERFVYEQQQEFNHWDHVYKDNDERL
jgi:hypothetical protein